MPTAVSDLAHNARVLHNFLTKSIEPHKERWLFPLRGRRMTLGQKATSALECLHRVMKNKKGLSVAPNMSLPKSYRTQNEQVDARMRQYNIKTAEAARSRSLFSRSATANDVTKVCESQIIQQKEQSSCYACSVESPWRIWFQRLPTAGFFCEQCDKHAGCGLNCCPTHSANSPITRFRRNRLVLIRQLGPNEFEVVCTCFFHPSYGIPCRHVAAVLEQILPHHVHVRWRTQVAAFYRDSRDPGWTEYFNKRKGDLRLVVTHQEYRQLLHNAYRLQELHATTLPPGFWQNVGAVHPEYTGMVSASAGLEDDDEEDPALEGFLSVDVGLSQDAQASAEMELGSGMVQRIEKVCAQTVQSSCVYESTKSSSPKYG